MPYTIRKVRNKDCYKVYDKTIDSKSKKKKVFAKCATLKNAKRQQRLLNAIKHNKSFREKIKLNK